jgi:death on curing protein
LLNNSKFLNLSEVLTIHNDQIDSFGGSFGIRDEGLLDSALAQPEATFSGELLHATIYEQAAAYLYHIAMNHPFIDGNKRTAFAVMDAFLRFNHYSLNLTNDQAYDLVIQVVERRMSKEDLSRHIEQVVLS